ncbi:MAG: DUF362 domain-containing protein [Spirochaetales bacterium]|nr:DUF362 domain-containing protein [Spirochaetales bacterium]
MEKSKVAVIRCHSYDEEPVYTAVSRGIELLGGVSRYTRKNEKILLKPNVLIGADPAKGISTHPSVFKAVARVLLQEGASLYYGDSSGMGKPITHLKRAGLAAAAEELGVLLADFINGREVSNESYPLIRTFTLANGALDCDGIINLPKMKTHALARVTGAVKNLFGCIPGFLKPQFHVKLPNPVDFCKMLVSLNLLLKPRLHIMDGVEAMEGNGPHSGTIRNMNVLLLSEDPIAIDSVMCRLMNLDPKIPPTITIGEEWGLGTADPEQIELLGDPLEPLIALDFNVVRKPVKPLPAGGIRLFLKNALIPRPVITESVCVKCGVCTDVCPVTPKALAFPDGNKTRVPEYDYRNCIRCYCCQELCPEGAITVRTPILGRIVERK